MKIAVVGLGKVGSALAFLLSQKNFVDELVLVGRNPDSIRGEALDLRHSQLFVDDPTLVRAGSAADTAGSDIIAICASVPTPKEMNSRLDLARPNVELLREILPPLAEASPSAKLVMLSNPVDVLTYFAIEITGFAAKRVLGTGTLVDSARFRQLLADEIHIHMEDIRAYILGEHGDSQFPAMSCAFAGGELLDDTPARRELFERARGAGFEVFRAKGYTNYAIAAAGANIIECIAKDLRHTLPVSLKVDGYLGLDDVCLSLPAVLGAGGVERVMHPRLNDEEQAALHASAAAIQRTIEAVNAG